MDFSIIGLSETWGKSVHIDMQHIPGYKHYYCIRAKNRNGGGTSLYVKSTIPFKQRSDLEFKKSIFESSVIEIDKHVFHSRHNIIVGIFYRSPNSTLSIYNDSLEKLLNVIQKVKKYAYIMGDFNVNTINEFTGTTPQCQQFTNIFLAHYYRKLIHLPTRVSGNSSSILDNIYTNHPLHEENGVIMTDITDHYSIFTVCEDPEPIINRKFRERRDYNIKNIVKFKNRLRNVNWEEKFASGSALHNFTEFYNSIEFLFNLTFPKEKIIIKYDNKNPWINNKLKADIVQREKLLIISKKNPTEINIQKYKSFKNRNLADQRAAERAHYKEQFGIFSDDLKTSFRVLRKLICKDNGHNMTNNIDFVIDKSIVADKTKIANGFNDYFVNVGSTLSSKIHCNVKPLSYVEANPNSMVIPNLTVGDIINAISSLNNSSAGYDEMPASILKKCIDEYITPITYLVNLSIRQGTFPNELKLAKVIPIFKSGNEQLINNYRPISVLTFFSKIYEKVMANFLIIFLDANGILSNFQFGFRHKHSTTHAIITLTEKNSKALDTGKIVCGIFIDFRKAFDVIPHKTLLKKLYSYGIRGNLYDWFESYLSERSQYVEFQNTQSDTKPITHGVPQESILGPILFIIDINDFSKSSEKLFSILYADDTSVFIEGYKYDKLIEIMNNEMKQVDIWLQANGLVINQEKTHYMVFHRARIKTNSNEISIRDNIIPRVSSTKFLGLIIDDQLKWLEHIQYIKNKVSKSVGILCKVQHYLDQQTLHNLYYTFVYPYLIYGVEIWGNACNSYIDPLIKLQKKCLRIITFSNYLAHTEPLFQKLEILSYKKLVIHRIAMLMYKNSKEIVPIAIHMLFARNDQYHNYNTR